MPPPPPPQICNPINIQKDIKAKFFPKTLLSNGATLALWGEGASLALVDHPSSDGVTIKMSYRVDVLH